MLELPLYLLVGALSGTLAGLFGIGGGLVIVPTLIYSLTAQGVSADVLTHIAVGTSLATIVFTSVNSIFAHNKHAAILWPLVRMITLGVVAGTALGALTASYLQGAVLQKLIGVFAIVMALQMLFQLTPKAPATPKKTGQPGLVAAGGIIGWASAIFGIAGGSLTVPFLLWRGLPMTKAIGSSSACGLPIALVGGIAFAVTGWDAEGLPAWSTGYIYWPALVGIAATSMYFAQIGAKLAHCLNPKLLKKLFAAMLLLIGGQFLLG